MQKLKNLSEINTNTVEGRLLIAALSCLSGTNMYRKKQPDEILHECHDIAEKIYKNADDIPLPEVEENPTFEKALERLINSYSKENESDTPDFILATYMSNCLSNYSGAVKARDKWFSFEPFSNHI